MVEQDSRGRVDVRIWVFSLSVFGQDSWGNLRVLYIRFFFVFFCFFFTHSPYTPPLESEKKDDKKKS